MPGDVAVADPGARVVDGEGDGQVAVARQRGRVAARRVLEVPRGLGPVEGAAFLGEHPEVVAVEVDGVVDAESRFVLDDEHGELDPVLFPLLGGRNLLVSIQAR